MATKKLTPKTKETVLSALELVIEEARQEFEAEKAEQLADWKKELARKKEEDEYAFRIEKRDREEELEQELKERAQAISERENLLAQREIDVLNAEGEFRSFKEEFDTFPAKLAAKEAEAYEKAQAEFRKEFYSELRLKEVQFNAEKQVLENNLTLVNQALESARLQVSTLQADLAAANNRVETIATNAVTASGQAKVTVQTAPNSK